MPARVGSGEQRRVSGSRARVCIIVIAVGKVRASIQEHAKSAVVKLIAIALKVVRAQLIDHDYDNEFRVSVVSGCKRGRGQQREHECDATNSGEFHSELVYMWAMEAEN